MCLAAAKSTCRIFPRFKHIPPTPRFVHGADAKPSVFREGALAPSVIYAIVPSLLSRDLDPLVAAP